MECLLYGLQDFLGIKLKKEEEPEIIKQINDSKSHIVFVGFSSPKKEFFLHYNKNLLTVPFCMGVGGSFDVYAGKYKRAPKWMQKAGLEWFYRYIQEPGRPVSYTHLTLPTIY